MAGERGWIYDHTFNGYPIVTYDDRKPRLVFLAGEKGDGAFDEATQTIFINILQALKQAKGPAFKGAVNFINHVYLHELIHSLTDSGEKTVECIALPVTRKTRTCRWPLQAEGY